jgi:hypothetical protein
LSASPAIRVGAEQPFPAILDLSQLDGTNGFAVDGIADSDKSGTPVSGGGDVDGDGRSDLSIGATGVDPARASERAGRSSSPSSMAATGPRSMVSRSATSPAHW